MAFHSLQKSPIYRKACVALVALALAGCAGGPIKREQIYLEGSAERIEDQERDSATFCSPDVRFEAGLARPLYNDPRFLQEFYGQHTSTPCGDSGRNGLGYRLRWQPWAGK